MWTQRAKGGLQLIWSLTAVIVWASQDGAILCSPVTAQTAGLWWKNNYGLIWVHLLRPVTAITAEHQQLSGWWLYCCDQVRSWWWFVIITLVFISCYGPYFHSWGLPRESLHYVPNGSLRRIFFIFPKHWRHQAVSAPGGSGASPGQEEPAAEEMGNVTAKNFKHRGFSLKLRSGETSVVMFNI